MPTPFARSSWAFLLVSSALFFSAQAVSAETVESSAPRFAATMGSPTIASVDYQTTSETATVSIDNVTQAEGNDGTTMFVFEVTLSEPIEKAASVHYMTMNGEATTENLDYVESSGTASFAPMSTSTTITISVNGDTKFEEDETFTVELSSPENATIGSGTGTGTILNDDVEPTISIESVSKAEGQDGETSSFAFNVTLSHEHYDQVTVDYETMDGSATTANGDYVAANGTATIAAKQMSTMITIDVIGDITFEDDETFTVVLSNACCATIGSGTGTGTIENDDGMPAISISDVSEPEGDGGTTAFEFEVTLSHAHYDQVTVHYETTDDEATTANNDYVSATGTATIAPKETSTTITITVNGDMKFEEDEDFKVMLSNPVNATIANGTGTGTIVNDDEKPKIFIDDVSMAEGDFGPNVFVFTVSLDKESGEDVTFDFATMNGSATWESGDYHQNSGTLTIPAKTNDEKMIIVTVNGDMEIEPDEYFVVNLFNIMNAKIGKIRGRGLIFNDDGLTGVDDPAVTVFALGSLAPNPFTDVTRIDYAVPREAEIRLSVYDIQGREVVVLASGIRSPGRHQAIWKGQIEGRPAAAGVYFVRYRVPGKDFVRRLAVTR